VERKYVSARLKGDLGNEEFLRFDVEFSRLWFDKQVKTGDGHTMSEKGQLPDNRDVELKARLDKLSGAIKSEMVHVADDRKAAAVTKPVVGLGKAMGTGFRVTSELVAGVLVGGFLGWWIDHWLGTKPFAFLIMLLVGMVAGFWNVYKIAMKPTGDTSKDT
jgi:ATP synthase protein I